jgi:hypothetical protein
MKLFKKGCTVFSLALLIVFFAGCGSSFPATGAPQYTNPAWAPAYTAGVRYYYMPDIETYYDLSNNDFAYMDNGQWLFSATLPPMYANYNLYNGFTVSLNYNVYQPWVHHQYYVSHYPRYYYRQKYQGPQHAGIRGFNENARQPFYRKPEDKNRTPEQGHFPQNNNNNEGNKTPNTRPAQNPVFRGRNIGQPVRVRPAMRQGTQQKNTGNNSGNKKRG